MKVTCLLVFLCVAVVYEAEAGWWAKATRWVGNAVGSVVGMVGKKNRRRRELSDDLDEETIKKVDIVCEQEHIDAITPDGIPFDVIKGIFDGVDKGEKGDSNDALNEEEVGMFEESLNIFEYCMIKGQKEKAP